MHFFLIRDKPAPSDFERYMNLIDILACARDDVTMLYAKLI